MLLLLAQSIYFLGHTLVKKRNSLPFHLQILKRPEGVQGGHGVRWNYTGPKKFLPIFFKIQVEQARSLFFEGVYVIMGSISVNLDRYGASYVYARP